MQRTLAPLRLDAYVPEAPAGALAYGFALAGLAGAAALVLARPVDGGRRRFAALWFLLGLAPSLLVVLADISVTAVAERYLYLPSVGLSLLAAAALTRHPHLLGRRAVQAAAAVALAGLAVLTVARNRVWHDEIALWTDVTRNDARFSLPHLNLGLALANAGRAAEAEEAYRAALDAEGSETTRRDATINLGHLELQQGALDAADELFSRANAVAPHASAYYGLGAVARARARAQLRDGNEAQALQDFARAEAALTAALAINPRHYQSHFLLASVRYQTGDLDGALAHYRRVVALAGDTATGRDAAGAVAQLEAWLSDPRHRSPHAR